MQGWLFREFLAYFKIKEREDKKEEKALGSEQGLRCHKLEARKSSELGVSVA